MKTITDLVLNDRSFLSLPGGIRSYFSNHPEWRVLCISLCLWAFLILNAFVMPGETTSRGMAIYCIPAGTMPVTKQPVLETQRTLKDESSFSMALARSRDNLVYWMIMVIVMMFPLLNEPVRHVAFSVRRKERNLAISWFLTGYIIIWAVFGVLLSLLPYFLDRLITEQTPFVRGFMNASGFLVAAILVWLPGRLIKMANCSQTMPIRIHGYRLHLDSIRYGLKMGLACLNICWAPMVGLILAQHTIILMLIVTIVLIYERYLLPHTSKLPGYAWGIVAITLLGIEILA